MSLYRICGTCEVWGFGLHVQKEEPLALRSHWCLFENSLRPPGNDGRCPWGFISIGWYTKSPKRSEVESPLNP